VRHIWTDARVGLRLLLKRPGFTTIAVLALALGIASTTAIFSVVYATLLAPLPYPEPDQLVMVWSRIKGNRNVSAAGTYLDWKRQATVFQDLNAFSGRNANLATADHPEQVQAGLTTPGFFRMVGNPMFLGRDFAAEEGQPGKDQVVILTHRMWSDRFAGDRGIVGRTIRIDGTPHTVVGVLQPGLADRQQSAMYLPMAFKPDQINHDFHWLLVMGRLKPEVSLERANANMTAVCKHLAELYPVSNQGWGASVEPLKNNFLSNDTQSALWFLLGAVGFVLLIACVNVANLLLARGAARQREIAVRHSLGAVRRRLFAQFLTESLVLAGIGGLLGVTLAWALLKGILFAMPEYTLPSEAEVELNIPVLIFTLGVSMLSGVLFGCVPAWQATRTDANEVLKESGRSISGGRNTFRRALVVAEFALALALLAGGGLAVHSLVNLANVDMGFRSDHLLTFNVPMSGDRYDGAERVTAFYDRLLERLSVLPGVTSASVSTTMPVYGTSFGMPFTIVGKPVSDPSQRPGAGFGQVTPEYFKTLGIEILKGRAFTAQDTASSVRVAIVNDTFVKRFFKGVDPLTQRLSIEQLIPGVTKLGPAVEWQVVGVSKFVRNGGPRDGDFPEIDVPYAQSPWPSGGVQIRTAGDPEAMQKSVTAVVQSLDPDLPIANVKTMDQVIHDSLRGDRFNTLLFGTFAVLALLLAALGIYGVMSFIVAQRTHEIGLRMALGAGTSRVLKDVLKEGLLTASIGLVLGIGGAYLVGRAMQGMWFGVGAIDLVALSTVTATLLLAALVACLIPARRASAVDPMVALRQE